MTALLVISALYALRPMFAPLVWSIYRLVVVWWALRGIEDVEQRMRALAALKPLFEERPTGGSISAKK